MSSNVKNPVLVFELTLDGYDANSSETDDRIAWVKASSVDAVRKWAADNGISCIIEVRELTWLDRDCGFCDGVDFIIRDTGFTVAADRDRLEWFEGGLQ